MLKTCTKCFEIKPQNAEYFPLHNKTKDGLDSWCRTCRASYRSDIRRGNYRHMISDADLKILLKNKKCDICGIDLKTPVVDHCHKENKIRGVLCSSCNLALGHFKDSTSILNNAIMYLNRKV